MKYRDWYLVEDHPRTMAHRHGVVVTLGKYGRKGFEAKPYGKKPLTFKRFIDAKNYVKEEGTPPSSETN